MLTSVLTAQRQHDDCNKQLSQSCQVWPSDSDFGVRLPQVGGLKFQAHQQASILVWFLQRFPLCVNYYTCKCGLVGWQTGTNPTTEHLEDLRIDLYVSIQSYRTATTHPSRHRIVQFLVVWFNTMSPDAPLNMRMMQRTRCDQYTLIYSNSLLVYFSLFICCPSFQ